MPVLMTIHGIRKHEPWERTLQGLSQTQELGLELLRFDYGYLPIRKVVWAPTRARILRDFVDFYDRHVDRSGPPPSIVCHSYGSFVVFSALKKYHHIKFDRVILFGSILNRELDLLEFFERGQVEYLLNQRGTRDGVVRVARFAFGSLAGDSGYAGFKRIPERYRHRIAQPDSPLEHGEAGVAFNMKKVWLPFLAPEEALQKFNTDILNTSVFRKIRATRCTNPIRFTRSEFSARVDDEGTYYARYSRSGVNTQPVPVQCLELSTIADATHPYEDMEFAAHDLVTGFRLSIAVQKDVTHHKRVRAYFREPIPPGGRFHVSYEFKWKSTMGSKGDTDHFWIGDTDRVAFEITFPYDVFPARVLLVGRDKVSGELETQVRREPDHGVTYSVDFPNATNAEGLVFYYESIGKIGPRGRFSADGRRMVVLGNATQVSIGSIERRDIPSVYEVDRIVDPARYASEEQTRRRAFTFPDGFLVVRDGNSVLGFLQSILWAQREIVTFKDVADQPLRHNPRGDSLYVNFVGVVPRFRRVGIGTALIDEAVRRARILDLRRVVLVAKGGREQFYLKRGFRVVQKLPDFLEEVSVSGTFMERMLQ